MKYIHPGPRPGRRSSPPSRGAWIETPVPEMGTLFQQSPPSRGAWIEIAWICVGVIPAAVAPLAGGVD